MQSRRKGERKRVWQGWLFGLLPFGLAIYYMQFGAYLSNIVAAALTGSLQWYCVNGLMMGREKISPMKKHRALFLTVLAYTVCEHLTWIASCIWWEASLDNPYIWTDFLLTMTFPPLLLCLRQKREGEKVINENQ
ncbi:MAG: hypothetical protein K5739_08920 [Lachnospiraceae bacterium]|nr:hypothetical protein [Lachnospiraceae bacterium]